jgi:hypothetical protein
LKQKDLTLEYENAHKEVPSGAFLCLLLPPCYYGEIKLSGEWFEKPDLYGVPGQIRTANLPLRRGKTSVPTKGRPEKGLHQRVGELLGVGLTARHAGCSTTTGLKIRDQMTE